MKTLRLRKTKEGTMEFKDVTYAIGKNGIHRWDKKNKRWIKVIYSKYTQLA